MDKKLEDLIVKSKEMVAKMTPDELAEMHTAQRESFVRGEMGWPKAKYKWVNGVKVYDSYEDYVND